MNFSMIWSIFLSYYEKKYNIKENSSASELYSNSPRQNQFSQTENR